MVLVLFVCILSGCTKDTLEIETTPELVQATNLTVVENDVLELVNTHRIAIGASTLQFSPIAYEYANKHTDYMIAKGKLSHDHFSSRAQNIAAKVPVEMVAENVAKAFDTAQGAFDEWYHSTAHKTTMEGDFTHTAVSVKEDAFGKYYYTQLFYKE